MVVYGGLAPAVQRVSGCTYAQCLLYLFSLSSFRSWTLARVLPPTLERLYIGRTGCGDAGMLAIATVLPIMLRFQRVWCNDNPDVGELGWGALAAILPQLTALQDIMAVCIVWKELTLCSIGSDGGAARMCTEPEHGQPRKWEFCRYSCW